MKLELSIKDDKKLRNLIKDMIKSQVLSSMREQMTPLVIESMSDKSIKTKLTDLKKVIENHTTKVKKETERQNIELKEYFKRINIKDLIKKEIFDFIQIHVTKELIIDIIKNEITKLVKDNFNSLFKKKD